MSEQCAVSRRPRIDLASAAQAWIDCANTDLFVEQPGTGIAYGSIRARSQLSVAALSSSSRKL